MPEQGKIVPLYVEAVPRLDKDLEALEMLTA